MWSLLKFGSTPLNATIARQHFDATMNEHTVERAITPLRLIFWGGLLCYLRFTLSETTNGRGFKLDVFDDAT